MSDLRLTRMKRKSNIETIRGIGTIYGIVSSNTRLKPRDHSGTSNDDFGYGSVGILAVAD